MMCSRTNLREAGAARAVLAPGEEEEAAPNHVGKAEKDEAEPTNADVAGVEFESLFDKLKQTTEGGSEEELNRLIGWVR